MTPSQIADNRATPVQGGRKAVVPPPGHPGDPPAGQPSRRRKNGKPWAAVYRCPSRELSPTGSAPNRLTLTGRGQRELVDLGGEDEIILREAADGVGVNLHPGVAVALEVQIGVMLLPLGDRADVVQKLDRIAKVLERPVAANPRAVVREPPAGERCELCL